MTFGICQHCGRFVKKRIESHHLIPRWCGGKDEDVMEVCHSCHAKLEIIFENFIKWGNFNSPFWENIRKSSKRHKEMYWENLEKSNQSKKEYYLKNREKIIKRQREREKRLVQENPNYWKENYQKRLKREPNLLEKKLAYQQTPRGRKIHNEANRRYKEKKREEKINGERKI